MCIDCDFWSQDLLTSATAKHHYQGTLLLLNALLWDMLPQEILIFDVVN